MKSVPALQDETLSVFSPSQEEDRGTEQVEQQLASIKPSQAQAVVGELGPWSEAGLSIISFLLQLSCKHLR